MIKTIPNNVADVLPATKTWPTQGDWTYQDFLNLPEDETRYEIIQGTLYMSPAPSFVHQFAVSRLCHYLTAHTMKHDLGLVLVAPFEIHFDDDIRPVQPDVVYIPKDKMMNADAKYFEGSPELVIEVLSPSTRRYDLSIKLNVYEQFSVREYWLVDPKFRSVTVYFLPENGAEYVLAGEYSAEETIKSQLLSGFELAATTIFPQ